MRNELKKIGIESCAYYLFNYMVNTKNIDPNKIEIDEKYAKIFWLISLDTWLLKTLAVQKLILWSLYTLLSLKKVVEINIWC